MHQLITQTIDTMTTVEAINEVRNTNSTVELLSINAKLIFSKNSGDISLIMNGSHLLSFSSNLDINTASTVVEEDLEYSTNVFNWLSTIEKPNVGTTRTYENAWRRGNKVFRSMLDQ